MTKCQQKLYGYKYYKARKRQKSFIKTINEKGNKDWKVLMIIDKSVETVNIRQKERLL